VDVDPLSPYLLFICSEILSNLIKYNDNIKGIKVGAEELLLAQYADDTSLLFDGSENSLRSTMTVLQFYANSSGLKIKLNKLRLFWIGSLKDKRDGICQDLGITWESETFTLLGVTFSKYLTDMVDINYQLKLNDIKNLLIQWSKRAISPIGENVGITTLALSKINHLILSLPNPNINIINNLQNIFYSYLWGAVPIKLKM